MNKKVTTVFNLHNAKINYKKPKLAESQNSLNFKSNNLILKVINFTSETIFNLFMRK